MSARVWSKLPCACSSRSVICAESLLITAIMAAWLSSIAVCNRLVRVANCSASVFNPSRNAAARWASARQRGALQVVLGEIDHHRDRLLDGRDASSRLVGGVRGERQVEGVGGDEAGGERLARLSERGQQQGVALADGALDDGVESGHLLGRLEHVVLVGVRDRGLDLADLAEALKEPLGDRAQFVGRAATEPDRRRRGCAACSEPRHAIPGFRSRPPGWAD